MFADATCQCGNRLVTQSWHLIGGVLFEATPQKFSPKPSFHYSPTSFRYQCTDTSYRVEELNMYLIGLILIFHSHRDLHLFVRTG